MGLGMFELEGLDQEFDVQRPARRPLDVEFAAPRSSARRAR